MSTTVVVSALVSAVVALGIEFFAKPRLEIRKDRILKRSQRWQEALAHVGRIGSHITDLESERAQSAAGRRPFHYEPRLQSVKAELAELESCVADVWRHHGHGGELMVRYRDTVRSFLAKVEDEGMDTALEQRAEGLEELSRALVKAGDAPWWGWRRRRNARRVAHRQLYL